MVGTIWCSSRSRISRSLEGSRHLPWLDKLRANLPDLLSESAEILLHCTLACLTSLSLFSPVSALAEALKYLRNRWQFCRGVMAREARNSRGPIFENKEMGGGRGEAKWGKEERRRTEVKGVTKLGETEERGEKYKRKARGNKTFAEDSRN